MSWKLKGLAHKKSKQSSSLESCGDRLSIKSRLNRSIVEWQSPGLGVIFSKLSLFRMSLTIQMPENLQQRFRGLSYVLSVNLSSMASQTIKPSLSLSLSYCLQSICLQIWLCRLLVANQTNLWSIDAHLTKSQNRFSMSSIKSDASHLENTSRVHSFHAFHASESVRGDTCTFSIWCAQFSSALLRGSVTKPNDRDVSCWEWISATQMRAPWRMSSLNYIINFLSSPWWSIAKVSCWQKVMEMFFQQSPEFLLK